MDFEDFEKRYAGWRLLVETGEISALEFAERVASLSGMDENGTLWRINPETEQWQRRTDSGWIPDDPHKPQPEPEPEPEVEEVEASTPAVTTASSPSTAAGSTPANWIQSNWGWLAVGGVSLVLIGVIIIVAQIIAETRLPAEADAPTLNPALPTGPAVVVEDAVEPTPLIDNSEEPETAANEAQDRGHTMILIPEGAFRMGASTEESAATFEFCRTYFVTGDECNEQGFSAELPAHDVTTPAFYIDKYEVTNDQYAAFLTLSGNQAEGGVPWYEFADPRARIVRQGEEWLPVAEYVDHPVTEVTWYGAQAYCRSRDARLPTEAEWEKAARWNPETGESNYYPWGDQRPTANLANYTGIIRDTSAVGSFPDGASPTGLMDMAGNVFEWVADWYDPNYYQLEVGDNPQGPEFGEEKILRGASWGDHIFLLHTTNRGAADPKIAANFIGFRCVKDPSLVTP